MTTINRSPLDEGYDFYITDNWNKEYHFKILTFEIPPGMLSVAVEAAEETELTIPESWKSYPTLMMMLNWQSFC